MNGAESLVKTLLDSGISVCFANPGTSEMHFVAALDRHPDMRCILCLFEGGATGAADGYYRMTGDLAATLLHLAPGFGNGFANLHTARKAGSGMLTIVGDHATHHMAYESPLRGDIPALSRSIAHWTQSSADAASVARDGAAAIAAARSKNGTLATLILPANTAWNEAVAPAIAPKPPALDRPAITRIEAAARTLSLPGAALIIDGKTLSNDDAFLAARIAQKTGARLIAPYLVSRIRRGAGSAPIERLSFGVEESAAILSEVQHMVLVGADRPVNFFAYPGKPSLPEAPGTAIHDLASKTMDIGYTLQALADSLGLTAEDTFESVNLAPPAIPTGATMDMAKIGEAFAALLPDDAIVVDESITVARHFMQPTTNAHGHDWMHTTGGAIGYCLPAAVGAAIACPDRRVIALSGDGSAMYTLQALWTMAREHLDITVIIIANRGYQILRGELVNVGVTEAGRNAISMLDVDHPLLDWVKLAEGHGVPGQSVTSVDEFVSAYTASLARSGPSLIEIVC